MSSLSNPPLSGVGPLDERRSLSVRCWGTRGSIPSPGNSTARYGGNTSCVEVEAGDFMWLRAFCPQACYAGGPGNFRYLLYKDVNRHAKLGAFSG